VRGWYDGLQGKGLGFQFGRLVGLWRWRLTASTSRKKPKGNHKLKLMTSPGGVKESGKGFGVRGPEFGDNEQMLKGETEANKTCKNNNTQGKGTKKYNNNKKNAKTRRKKSQLKSKSGRDLPLTVFVVVEN